MQYNNHSFEYTYSAPQQEEIRRIREKYIPREEDKLERIRRLDNAATQKATVCSLVAGIFGALVMGTGMSLAMVGGFYFIGIPVGIAGMAGIAAAYPLYTKVIKTERAKIAPEILRLTDELMK